MAKPADTDYAEIARVAYQLWEAMNLKPDGSHGLPGVQLSLEVYRECFKAVASEPFDVTKLKRRD